MTVEYWLQLATTALRDSGVGSARLDALILLEDCLQLDRAQLLAHPEQPLTDTQLNVLADHLERRMQHEPLAYIRGFAEFYGRRFAVTPDVLVPRPESETIIELLKNHMPAEPVIADIGTGSGCLAISAALETGAVVYAVDIDEACLAVAGANAVCLTAPITCLQGSLLELFLVKNVPEPNILLANLPYVPDDFAINEAARHEPAMALFGGADGLDLYRELFSQVQRLAVRPLIITESLEDQHTALVALAASAGYTPTDGRELIHVFQ